jgi:hypothetical protein
MWLQAMPAPPVRGTRSARSMVMRRSRTRNINRSPAITGGYTISDITQA